MAPLGKMSFDGEGVAPRAASEFTLPEVVPALTLQLWSDRLLPSVFGHHVLLTVGARDGKLPAGLTCRVWSDPDFSAPTLLLPTQSLCSPLSGVHLCSCSSGLGGA